MLRPSSSRSTGKPLGGLAIFIGLICFSAVRPAAAESARPIPWRQHALAAEKRGEWLKACRYYDEVLRKDRNNTLAREGYQRCLRRLHLVARHSDSAYRQGLARMTQEKALLAYEQVLAVIAYSYPDRARTDLTQLFQQGLQEARLALDDPVFRQHYLNGVKPALINTFKARLVNWPVRKITRTSEAREHVWSILRQASRDGLPARSTFERALALEFAAGACNSLDEYSSFLTAGHLAGGRGKLVGVGLELGLSDDKLQITRIYRKSPAEEAGLQPGDRIFRVAGRSVQGLPSDAVADKLRGEPGSVVEVEYQSADAKRGKLTARLKRRAISVPAVDPIELRQLDDATPIGYLRINYFNDSTLQEVREALFSAPSMGMSEPLKGLILDLRGNPGGMFTSAVAVAELFLSGGVVVVGQSAFPDYNRSFKSESSSSFQFPVVVLIDGETASSAEVLAAALQYHRPGSTKLVGQPSFGKGSVQCLIQLKKTPLEKMAGIRLTVAKLFSPSNQALTGKGLVPDVTVKSESDILAIARKELQKLMSGEPTPPVMGAGSRASQDTQM